MRNLYCENCFEIIKSPRNGCKCGHYDNTNYHNRVFIYLDDSEVQIEKRKSKLKRIGIQD